MESKLSSLKKTVMISMAGSFLMVSIDSYAQQHQGSHGPNPKSSVNKSSGNKGGALAANKTRRINASEGSRTINKSRTAVNVNVNRSVYVHRNHNTVVRRNPVIVYSRPFYKYRGYRFNAYYPYHYHPYRPFYWGAFWHPWGFFTVNVPVTAVVLTVESYKYYYDQGVWYRSSAGGYTVVPAPVGAKVDSIPGTAQRVALGNTGNYYYGGTYYEKEGNRYRVVAPTAGIVVENLPEGGEEVMAGEVKYIKFGETYYQPIKVDGVEKYEVALVEEDN